MFVDTPGIFKPKRRLDRAMVTSAWGGAGDADVVALLIDVRKGIDEENEAILAKLPDVRRPKILILNKIDLIERSPLLGLAATLNARSCLRAHLHGLGADRRRRRRPQRAARRDDAARALALSRGPDSPTRRCACSPPRSRAKKIYERLHEELPYQSTVETDQWQERPDGSVRIEQTIFVERESQRKIVLGKGGQTIKAIGQAARKEHRRDHRSAGPPLPVRQGARELGDDPERYREMGLEFPKE